MWSGKEVREEKGGRGEGRISHQGVRGTKETRIAFEMDKSRVFQQEDRTPDLIFHPIERTCEVVG